MPNWKKLVVSGSSAHLYNLDVTNAVTASYFKGDGSGLTNVNATVVDVATVVDTFTAATTKVVNHNFNSRNILVSVYDNDYNQIIPASVNVSSLDSVTITFTQASTGFAVIAKGGHIVSGSVVNIQEVATQVDTFTSQTTYTATHSFNTKDVFVTVYDNNDSVIIPSSIKTLTTGSVQLTFANSTSGRVVIGKAGHVITTNGGSGVVTWASVTGKPSGLLSGSVSYNSLTNKPVGLLSGSVSYTALTNKPNLVSGSSQINFLQLANKPVGLLSGSIFPYVGTARVTGSLFVTGSFRTKGTATFGNVTSTPSTENTLSVFAPPAGGTGEGGQILIAAAGGTYTSASMLDTYQDQFRILKGTNTGGSTAAPLTVNLHNGNTTVQGTITAAGYSGLPNAYLYVWRSTSQTIGSGNWANRDVIFNNAGSSSGISYNTSTGIATLTAGKVYRITATVAWSAAAAYVIQFQIYNQTTSGFIGPVAECIQPANASYNTSAGVIDYIYAPGTSTQISIKTTNSTTALSGEYIRGDLNTSMIIQQLA
jgi:hypothetical protein